MAELNLMQVMVVKIPESISLQDRVDYLNDAVKELQYGGYNILDINEMHTGNFLIQYRKIN